MSENNAVIRLNPMEMEVLCTFHAGTLSATFDRLCAAENAETDIARKREIRKLVRILPAFGPDAVVCLDFYSPNQSGGEPIVEPNYARMYSKLLDAQLDVIETLKQAQVETEAIFLEPAEGTLIPFPEKDSGGEDADPSGT